MKKSLVLFLLTSILGLSSCDSLSPEEAKESVIEGTRERVPLLVQQMMYVDNITIDSMHLLVETEPMSGYLYTTWTTGETSLPIIVEVTDIRLSKKNNDLIEWQVDWEPAKRAFFKKTMPGEVMSLFL